MNIVSSSLISSPPSALEIIYTGTLPESDRKVGVSSAAFPVAYYEGRPGIPEEVVIAPTNASETINRTKVTSVENTFTEGYDLLGISGQVAFYVPDYSASYPSITGDLNSSANYFYKTKNSSNKIDLFYPTSTIKIVSVTADSVSTWYPTIKNGYLYRDIEITQEELTYSATGTPASGYYSGSWLSAAGFVAGDKVRLFYTLPQNSINFNYSNEGEKFIENQKQVVRDKFSEVFHENNGNIYIGHENIISIEKLEELSAPKDNIIFSGESITGDYSGTTFRITNFSADKGEMTVLPPPQEGGLLSAEITREVFEINYKGFYDDRSGLWQSLDLNPQEGHIYNSGLDRTTRVNRSSEDLIYRTVVLYLLPVGALKLNNSYEVEYPATYYSAYVEGGKSYTWCPLRHYVQDLSRGSSSSTTTGKEIASWGYGTFDVSTYAEDVNFTAADKGIPLNQESAILISRLKIRPKENIEISDARRFSGLPGNYDRKTFTSDGTDPKTSRWDTSPWEGLISPLGSTVLVELDSSIISSYGIPYIEEIVKKHLPPGVVPVIRPK